MLYDDLVMPGEYICHHGIKGQKWGIRRFQNEDGSLTKAGIRRYGNEDTRTAKQWTKLLNDESRQALAAKVSSDIAKDDVELLQQKRKEREAKGKTLKARHERYLNDSMQKAEEYLNASKDLRKNIDEMISKIPKDMVVNSKDFRDTVWDYEAKFPNHFEPLLKKFPPGYKRGERGIYRTSFTRYSGDGTYYTHFKFYDNTKYSVKKNKE